MSEAYLNFFKSVEDFRDWRKLILLGGEKGLLEIILNLYDQRMLFENTFENHTGVTPSNWKFYGFSISTPIDFEGMKSLNLVLEKMEGVPHPVLSIFMHPEEYTRLYSNFSFNGPLFENTRCMFADSYGPRKRFEGEMTVFDQSKDKTRISFDFARALDCLFDSLQGEFEKTLAKNQKDFEKAYEDRIRTEAMLRENARLQRIADVATILRK